MWPANLAKSIVVPLDVGEDVVPGQGSVEEPLARLQVEVGSQEPLPAGSDLRENLKMDSKVWVQFGLINSLD